jgi:hypothetical protein
MTVDEAIEKLKAEKAAGIKNIIAVWWGADELGRIDDADWARDAERICRDFDWSNTHDDIITALDSLASEVDK